VWREVPVYATVPAFPSPKEIIYIPEVEVKSKAKVHPRTDHEGPEGSRGLALLFL